MPLLLLPLLQVVMMMMMVVLMPVFQIVVVIVLGGPGPRVARLQFLVEVVRQLPDHLRRVVLLLLSGTLL